MLCIRYFKGEMLIYLGKLVLGNQRVPKLFPLCILIVYIRRQLTSNYSID